MRTALKWIFVFFAVFITVVGTINAQNRVPPKAVLQKSTLLSPHCDEARIRQLAGDALVQIQSVANNRFAVTLDSSKLTFTDLTKKMQHAGCF